VAGSHGGVRRLAAQLPECGYPGGVAAASWSLLAVLLMVSALTGFLLDGRTDEQASQAYLDVQRDLVVDAAKAVGATSTQHLADLRMASAGTADDAPEAVLDRLAGDEQWRGTAVVSADRWLLATRGEVVPTDRLPRGDGATVTTSASGEPLLLSAISLPGGNVLAATSTLRLPGPGTGSLALVTDAGTIVSTSQTSPVGNDRTLAGLAAKAGRSAGGPGNLLGQAADGLQPTVAYADATHGPHLTVVSATYATTTAPIPGGRGLVPAVTLAIVAVAGFLVVRFTIVHPVRRLRADALAVAAGALRADVRVGGPAEVGRIAAALRSCQRTLLRTGERRRRPRRSLPVATGLTVATVAVLGWSGVVATQFTNQRVEVPPDVVTTMGGQTAGASDAVRRSLNEGVADLRAVAEADAAALPTALRELAAAQPRYRGVYVVDATGHIASSAGREPLRAAGPVPGGPGLGQQDGAGRVPVIFAHVPLPDGRVVVGEFDLDHLATLLSRAAGDARIVDAKLRTISATFGYVAFEPMTDGELRDAAGRSRAGAVVAEVGHPDGTPAVVSSAPLTGGATTGLGWTLVAQRPVADLALPASQQGRDAQLVALLAGLLACAAFGWQLVTVVRPLRRLATAATRLVNGNRTEHVVAQRHDEIGTVASCLELCRQALNDGPTRLGPVRRPLGAATEETALIPVARV
jgi:HAMP domain-containing protein